MQYEILCANGHFDESGRQCGADERLEEKVNKYIADGWRPIGGVSATYSRRENTRSSGGDLHINQFFQAMVKD